jgi:hypothetical protein
MARNGRDMRQKSGNKTGEVAAQMTEVNRTLLDSKDIRFCVAPMMDGKDKNGQ